MSWIASLFIAFLSGVLGLFCAAGIAALCADWFRISSFEGKAGYFLVFTAIIGGMASLAVGLIAARIVAAGESPGFFKGLGAAWGAVLVISLVVLAICRLRADIAPQIDGKYLELEIEVRCPKNFQLPKTDDYGATAGISYPGGRRLPSAKFRLDEMKKVDGQLTLPATVPLTTSSSKKNLNIRFNDEHHYFFSLPLRAHPRASDLEWSQWAESSGWDARKPEPAKEAKFNLRYRVKTIEPEPPPPDPEVVRAQEFAALKPDASLEQLLPFLFEGPTPESTRVVVKAIEERQVELAKLVRSTNAHVREYALRAAEYPQQPAPEVVEAVLAEGKLIAEGIRAFNGMKKDDPRFYEVRGDLNSRFNYWKQAWWTIHQRLGLDGRPPVKEIHDLTITRENGNALDEIEVNARVILDQLNKTAAEKKP